MRAGFVIIAMQKAQIIPHPKMIIRPYCENCDAQMWLVFIEPDKPGHDRRTFECPRCQLETVEIVKYRWRDLEVYPTNWQEWSPAMMKYWRAASRRWEISTRGGHA
jgi:hypothetical protein